MAEERWTPGETVVVQEWWRGSLWQARPMTVAVDEDGLIALWLPRGTRWKVPTTPSTRPYPPTRGERIVECLTREDWVLKDRTWELDTLWLMERDAAHAVGVGWDDHGHFIGWYVNLQHPYSRAGATLTTFDLALDVVVSPDGSWSYKDEDEFALMVDAGFIDQPGHVWDEAHRAIGRLEANEPPFCDAWPQWRPDSAWRRPEFPDGVA